MFVDWLNESGSRESEVGIPGTLSVWSFRHNWPLTMVRADLWWEIVSLLGDKSFPGGRKDLAQKFVGFLYW